MKIFMSFKNNIITDTTDNKKRENEDAGTESILRKVNNNTNDKKHSSINLKQLIKLLKVDGALLTRYYIIEILWILFLFFKEKTEKEGLSEKKLLGTKYSWSEWTQNKEYLEHPNLMLSFVKEHLFPYLSNIDDDNLSTVFTNIGNTHITKGEVLVEIVKRLNAINISLKDMEDTHIISTAYEEMLLGMGNEGSWSEEYYTPRAVIKLILEIVKPNTSDKEISVLDPFAGSGGFLAETFNFIKRDNKQVKINVVGFEKKFEAYLVGLMNLILHGINNPTYILGNTFTKKSKEFEEKYDIIFSNPPFGGKESKDTLKNIDWLYFKTNLTEALGLQFIMKALKRGGKAGVILPVGQIMSSDGVFQDIRSYLIENFNLSYIIFLPEGTFASVGTGVQTAVLIFEKGEKTRQTVCFKIKGKYTKRNKIQYNDIKPLVDYLNGKLKNLPSNILKKVINWEEIRMISSKLETYVAELRLNPNKINEFWNWWVDTEFFKQKQNIDKIYYKQIIKDIKEGKENIDKLIKEIQSERANIKYTLSIRFEDKDKVEVLSPNELLDEIDNLFREMYGSFGEIRKLVNDFKL